jgi:Domain of unknown function (DUF4326)
MTKPVRLQLSRKARFNLQLHSLSVNGLPAVNCARPGRWGNMFSVAEYGRDLAVAHHRRVLIDRIAAGAMTLDELRGKNTACWCPLPAPGQPDICHAATLLELANK